ncbi:GNAT family N-acetyltransferase [Bradyrhizobium sp. 2TAF24]|uniref:GNAT family N-acetyltransferase n=1 Tax=Bradyrhizobium sp. 2TAF24 TaxID=3233011 RepID=UPI003F8E37B4
MADELVEIERLTEASGLARAIAATQFKLWDVRTGHSSQDAYERFLSAAARAPSLPSVLVARRGQRFVGSVNLLASEMTIRPALSPWMGQLLVTDEARGTGVGRALVGAAIRHVADLGFRRIHLYTSGTLPSYYARLGWKPIEDVSYLGKLRTVMVFEMP